MDTLQTIQQLLTLLTMFYEIIQCKNIQRKKKKEVNKIIKRVYIPYPYCKELKEYSIVTNKGGKKEAKFMVESRDDNGTGSG